MLNADPFSGAEGSSGPARVDDPAGGSEGFHLVLRHVGVDEGVMHHEGGPEAGAESDPGFGTQADLRSGDLGGVPAEEVVDSLIRRRPRNGRKNTGRVTGEKEDGGSLAAGPATLLPPGRDSSRDLHRVFPVNVGSSRSGFPVTGSKTTFPRMARRTTMMARFAPPEAMTCFGVTFRP